MFLCLLLAAALRFAEGAPALTKINPRIFQDQADGDRTSFLVVLRDRADVSAAAAIGDRFARRRFVYETLSAHAEATQSRLRRQLDRAGVPFRPHFLANVIEVEGDAELARNLAANDEVSAIEPNAPAMLQPVNSPRASLRVADSDVEPNIQKIRAPEMWARGFTGQGVVIGIADTGFQWDHPALKSQYRGWNGSSFSHDYNWHDAIHHTSKGNPCGTNAPAPCDDLGHGTATSSLAVGDGGDGNRVGVAPGARLIGCRNMDKGSGTPATYTECFEWLLAPTDPNGENPRPDLGADVISNSWTCSATEGCTDPTILRDVVENVRAAGIPVVVAAGNTGFACGGIARAPAIFDASFTIGSTEMDDGLTVYSSPGPVVIDGSFRIKPNLCAPGTSIRVASPGGDNAADAYTVLTGTSMSTPQVAGAIALLWSALPTLAGNVDATERALETGAVPLTSPQVELDYPTPDELAKFCDGLDGLSVPNILFGWGRLDIEEAYERLLSRAPPRGSVLPVQPLPPILVETPPR